nr:uncharacterized protein LOC113810028 [Penaeus vannamei]
MSRPNSTAMRDRAAGQRVAGLVRGRAGGRLRDAVLRGGDAPSSYLGAPWSSVAHLSGLRLWLKNPEYDEESGSAKGLPGRVLLSYRDFTPRLGGKSLFSRGYEDTLVLLGRLNDYLRDRVTPARILSVHTLDAPMDGVLDMGADTEKSRISYAQHGFTR